MTAEAVAVATMPPRPARRSLVWTVAFTALWMGLNVSLPALLGSGLPSMAARVMVMQLIALGWWLGLERAELTPAERRTTWLAVMVPLTL